MSKGRRFPLLFVGSALVVVLLIVLVSQLAREDEEKDDRAVATAPASIPEATETSESTTTQSGSSRNAASSPEATLAAGDTDLLPLPDGGLASLDGEEVKGTRLVVVAIEGEDRFSVGRRGDDPERIEVEHDSSYVPKVDDRVNLSGVVDGSRIRAESVVPEGAGPGAGGDADVSGGEEDRP